MNFIESFLQNTDAEKFTISVFNIFFIFVHDDEQTEIRKTIMTKYY